MRSTRIYQNFIAFTKCDSNSALSGLGKKKGLAALLGNKEHQSRLRHLGADTGTKTDEVRYWLFCQNGQINKSGPSISDSPIQHPKCETTRHMCGRHWNLCRIYHQLINMVGESVMTAYSPSSFTKAPAPKYICCRAGSLCWKNDMPCTEECAWFAK